MVLCRSAGTPDEFWDEAQRIADVFLNSDREIEDIIEEMASLEYKAWMSEESKRIANLRKRGILV